MKKYFVNYELGDCGGGFDIEAVNDHDAHKQFFAMLESKGLLLDDVEEFSITEMNL